MPVHVMMRQAAIFGAAIRGLELDPEQPPCAVSLPSGPAATR